MDENGLELSLGLSFGVSSGNLKKKGTSSDSRAEGDDQGNKIVGEFTGFLSTGKINPDVAPVSQFDVVKVQENFFSDLSKANARNDEGEVGIEGTTNKRKMMFDEVWHQKKNPREPKFFDAQDKSRTSQIAINTEECSVADNEDVAELEADDSTLRLVLYPNTKDVHEYNVGNLTYGIPFSVHPMNVVTQRVPLRNSSFVSAPGKAMTSGNMPVIVGYSLVPLPTMDKDNLCMLAPHTPYPGKGPPTYSSPKPGKSKQFF